MHAPREIPRQVAWEKKWNNKWITNGWVTHWKSWASEKRFPKIMEDYKQEKP